MFFFFLNEKHVQTLIFFKGVVQRDGMDCSLSEFFFFGGGGGRGG